ncbi:RNA methyltransferase [Microvirga sp. W0021]|uniref:RNA methyltransferase n=1 Tax=Hohaiivirga grylli TaxID=3133970 RepID=A0ABV0BH13_9HYPH
MSEQLLIQKLGAKGDGIAFDGNRPVYVAGTLPGEEVLVDREDGNIRLVEVLKPSSERIKAFCAYYDNCGGCATQHMSASMYQTWKRDIVVMALKQANIETDIAVLEDAHGDGRRRMTLHIRYINKVIEAGFMAPRSHALVAIDHCPVTVPALHKAPNIAREIGKVLGFKSKPVSIQFTASDHGLDVDIRGHGQASDSLRQKLIVLAEILDLARIAIHGDVLVERKSPSVKMGASSVIPPAGGFLQATEQGELTLASHVLKFAEGTKKVADLFSGCGPFALRLAQKAEVHAVESDAASLAALDKAYRVSQGLRRISTETRDLFRRPLLKPELESYDCIVMDPPRAGAEAQARQIAGANVPRIVSVSCDPGTFARDAAIMINGGYTLEQVIPVDQFTYSTHVETVSLFTKQIKKKLRRRIS